MSEFNRLHELKFTAGSPVRVEPDLGELEVVQHGRGDVAAGKNVLPPDAEQVGFYVAFGQTPDDVEVYSGDGTWLFHLTTTQAKGWGIKVPEVKYSVTFEFTLSEANQWDRDYDEGYSAIADRVHAGIREALNA